MDKWLREHLGKRVRLLNPGMQFAVEGVLQAMDGQTAVVKMDEGQTACVRLDSVPLLIALPPQSGLVAARAVPGPHALANGRAK